MSTASGSCGAIHGAKIVTAMITRSTAAAPTPQRRRPRRRQLTRAAAGSAPGAAISASSAWGRALMAGSGGADAGIDEPHDEIHDEVHGDDEQGEQHHRALHDREVLVADGVHRERGHPRPREDRLRDDGAAQE